MGGAVFSVIAGIYYWYPEDDRPDANERLGKISFWVMFIGFNATFFVQHALGPVGDAATDLHLPARAWVGRRTT